MSEQINFELVSPEEKLVSEPVAMAVIPGTEGEMGIGRDHAPLVTTLQAGLVKLYMKPGDSKPRRIFIAGGFADITGASCMVLAEQAEDLEKMDRKALEQERANLAEDLGIAQEAADKARIGKKLDLVERKLRVISDNIAA